MKIRIHLKDPDGVYESVRDGIHDHVKENMPDCDEGDVQTICEQRKEDIAPILKKWIEYEEYVTIEIDTETGTAIVLPVSR